MRTGSVSKSLTRSVRSSCGYYDDPVTKDEYFIVEYADLGGAWEMRSISQVSPEEIESLKARQPVAAHRPHPSELSSEAWFWILLIVVPIAFGAVLFVVVTLSLRRRKKHEVDRPAGAGISVASGEAKPAQRRSHWTINPPN